MPVHNKPIANMGLSGIQSFLAASIRQMADVL